MCKIYMTIECKFLESIVLKFNYLAHKILKK